MKREIAFLFVFFLFSHFGWSNVAIFGYNSDSANDLVFVVTNPAGIAMGTTLFFTDNEYENGGNSFNVTPTTGDGTLQLVTSVSLPQGSVVVISESTMTAINVNGGASVGTVTEPDTGFNLANSSDALYAYTTSNNMHDGPVNNVCSVFTDNGYDNTAEDPSATYPNAIVVDLALGGGDEDNSIYDPANGTVFASAADFITAIQNSGNYQTTDGGGDQSIDFATLFAGITFVLMPNVVPTLSEWGLIFLALLLLNIGVIFSMNPKVIVIGFGANFNLREIYKQFPFSAIVFQKSLLFVSILAGVVGCLTYAIYEEITVLDFCGSLFCAPLLTYLIHFLIIAETKNERKRNQQKCRTKYGLKIKF